MDFSKTKWIKWLKINCFRPGKDYQWYESESWLLQGSGLISNDVNLGSWI